MPFRGDRKRRNVFKTAAACTDVAGLKSAADWIMGTLCVIHDLNL